MAAQTAIIVCVTSYFHQERLLLPRVTLIYNFVNQTSLSLAVLTCVHLEKEKPKRNFIDGENISHVLLLTMFECICHTNQPYTHTAG